MSPEPPDQATLRAGVGSRWTSVDVVAETGSTNADLAAGLRAGDPVGRVLVSGYQSAGRGRRGRVWTAPPGTSLAISVTVRPLWPEVEWTWIPLVAGLAVAEAIGDVTAGAVTPVVKWPNDVLVDEAKLCGILAERLDTPEGPAVVLGMGINTALTTDQLPVPTATSLAILLGDAAPGATAVAGAVLSRLADELDRRSTDPAGAAQRYAARCTTLGRDVVVHVSDDRTVRGRALGVDPDGRLRVATPGGPVILGAGDVVHVR